MATNDRKYKTARCLFGSNLIMCGLMAQKKIEIVVLVQIVVINQQKYNFTRFLVHGKSCPLMTLLNE